MAIPAPTTLPKRPLRKSLDVSGLLQRQEQIGGLAITEQGVSLVFAPSTRKGIAGSRKAFEKQVPLAEGTIVDGMLVKEAPLLQALQALKTKARLPSRSVVVSLPATVAQPFLFELLPHLTDEEAANAVSLLMDASLPLPKGERYTDWQEYEISRTEGVRRRAMVAMGTKSQIDPYLSAIQKAGFVPVACETHTWSLVRSLPDGGMAPILLADFTASRLVVVAAEQGIPIFQFDVPRPQVETPDALALLLQRIQWFLVSDPAYGMSPQPLVLFGPKDACDVYQPTIQAVCSTLFPSITCLEATDAARTLAAGAAKRGLLARKDDHVTSFLSVGTEVAYARQQLLSFLWFLEKLCVVFGLFFIALFAGALVLMSIVSRTTAHELAIEQIGLDQNFARMSESVDAVNHETTILAQLIRAAPYWEPLFVQLDGVWKDGLSVTRLDLVAGQPVNLGGIAQNREDLLQLREALRSSPAFQPITLPLSVLVQKEQIPFTVTLTPKDVNILRNTR